MSNRRVVITGTGLITALGTGMEKNWQALLAGKSGIGPDHPVRCRASIDARIAGEVKDFDPEEFIDRREVRRMDLFTQYALAATEMAMKESGLPIGTDKPHGYDPEQVGVIVGSGIGGLGLAGGAAQEGAGEGLRPPLALLHHPDDHQHGARADHHQLRAQGPELVPGVGVRDQRARHRRGGEVDPHAARRDAVIAGGSEAAITPLGIGGFAAMKALSTRNDDPARASRPFDKDRDGFVEGEGAGIVVLEELEHAKKRGANILAEVVGLRRQLRRPPRDRSRRRRARARRAACAWRWRARGCSPRTSATSTRTAPRRRSTTPTRPRRSRRSSAPHARKMAISSTKSMTGHMLGAAGGAEAVVGGAGAHPRRDSRRPSTTRRRIRTAIWTTCRTQPREVRVDAVMSNCFGFGGTNAVLVLKRYSK